MYSHLQKYRLYLKRLAGLPPNAKLPADIAGPPGGGMALAGAGVPGVAQQHFAFGGHGAMGGVAPGALAPGAHLPPGSQALAVQGAQGVQPGAFGMPAAGTQGLVAPVMGGWPQQVGGFAAPQGTAPGMPPFAQPGTQPMAFAPFMQPGYGAYGGLRMQPGMLVPGLMPGMMSQQQLPAQQPQAQAQVALAAATAEQQQQQQQQQRQQQQSQAAQKKAMQEEQQGEAPQCASPVRGFQPPPRSRSD